VKVNDYIFGFEETLPVLPLTCLLTAMSSWVTDQIRPTSASRLCRVPSTNGRRNEACNPSGRHSPEIGIVPAMPLAA